MTDPTLTEALSTPCRRCYVFPILYGRRVICPECFNDERKAYTTRQWVEMNKEVEDGNA